MDTTKLMAIIFGATGFWKLLEVLLKWRSDKKRTQAETYQVFERANTQILGNWVAWSQKLEETVRQQENEHHELEEKIVIQQNRIAILEKEVAELKQTNAMILSELKTLKALKSQKENKSNDANITNNKKDKTDKKHGIQSK